MRAERQLERLEAVGREALAHWNIRDASLHLIKHRENAVFRVERDGTRHALRLHRHGYHSDAELESELVWMQALAAAGVTVPTIVPTDSGDLFVTQSGEGLPGEIQIDLFEWIDGEPLGSVERGVADEATVAETYRTLGELAAKVHNQSASWALPAGFVRHCWDADGLAGENPFWGQFWKIEAASRSQEELLTKGRDRVHADLHKLSISPDVYSMIHADFAPENVMVGEDGPQLIDFDDAGFGWHVFELVTSLYFILGEPYFDEAQQALLGGYRSVRPLSDEQLDSMPLLFLSRGLTYVGWVHTRPETETARELTPMLLETACELAEEYLSSS